jgi:hypothetical protein
LLTHGIRRHLRLKRTEHRTFFVGKGDDRVIEASLGRAFGQQEPSGAVFFRAPVAGLLFDSAIYSVPFYVLDAAFF